MEENTSLDEQIKSFELICRSKKIVDDCESNCVLYTFDNFKKLVFGDQIFDISSTDSICTKGCFIVIYGDRIIAISKKHNKVVMNVENKIDAQYNKEILRLDPDKYDVYLLTEDNGIVLNYIQWREIDRNNFDEKSFVIIVNNETGMIENIIGDLYKLSYYRYNKFLKLCYIDVETGKGVIQYFHDKAEKNMKVTYDDYIDFADAIHNV